MDQFIDNAVALAAVDFQNDVQAWGQLPEALATYLRTEAFPISAPPSLRDAADYNGIKIFAYQERYLCLAYFFNGSKTDAYQRAIPSARVLVLDKDLLQGGFRNLPALTDFLMDASLDTATFDEHLFVLRSIYTEASITDSADRFESFFAQQGFDFGMVATAIGLLVSHGRLEICCPERSTGLAFFSALFALSPIELLKATAWCTFVDSVQRKHEDVVVHTCQLAPPEPESWLERLKSRLGRGDEDEAIRIDIENGVIVGHHAKSPEYDLTRKIIHELRDDTMAFPGTFEDRFRLFQGILGCLYSMEPYKVRALMPADLATDEVITRLESFLEVKG